MTNLATLASVDLWPSSAVMRYLHADQLGSTVLTTYTSGARESERGYYAFGSDRRVVGTPATDHRFTGQKVDGSGLYYYNARYYDPVIGQFVSPDTIVPEPNQIFAYNRYMYGLGNPLRYIDPTGHYPDEQLKVHFGCEDWTCVEAQFGAGGQHEGRWGWLATLMAAEDGDMVTAWSVSDGLYQEVQGRFTTRNGAIMVAPTRLNMSSPSWDSPVNITEFAGDFSELDFAGRGVGLAGMYSSSRGPTTGYGQRHLDCRHTDCTARALNAMTTGSAGVAAVCASSLVGNAGCTQIALAVSTTFGSIGAARTVIKASIGEARALDAALAVTLVKAGTQASPISNLGISLAQWGWDEAVAPRLPERY